MKEYLSSLDISFLCSELGSRLAGARIDKVYEIGEREIKLTLRILGGEGKGELIIAPNYFCLTKFEHNSPDTPSALTMVLRKTLGGAIIDSVSQHEFDRIVEFDLGERGKLIIELFSRGNLIVTDKEGVIIALLEGQEWKDRTLTVGIPYLYPPGTHNIKDISEHEFIRILAEKKEIGRSLSGGIGLGGEYGEEVLLRCDADEDDIPNKESGEQAYTAVEEMLHAKVDARIVKDGSVIVSAVPFPLELYKKYSQEPYPDFNSAIDEHFTKIRNEGIKADSKKDYEKEIGRFERIIAKQERQIDEMNSAALKFKAEGDFIFTNYAEINKLILACHEAKLKGSNWAEYINSIGLRIISGADRIFEYEGVPICIDKTVSDNAEERYLKYKKAKSKIEGSSGALIESRRELGVAKRRKDKVEQKLPENPTARHVPEWYEKFRWFKSSNGFLCIGGRDATTNEILIKKHTDEKDLIFHSTVHGAPFFVVKNPEGKEIPKSTKREAAEGAASYSSAWGAGWGAADVYCVRPDQVSKTPKSGEYLTKGAFVVRGEREWFKNTPLKIALGFRVTDYAISIGGPETAVAKEAKHYANVIPGTMKSGLVAKEAKARILRETNKEDGQKIKKVILGEIQRWIPAGKGMLAK